MNDKIEMTIFFLMYSFLLVAGIKFLFFLLRENVN